MATKTFEIEINGISLSVSAVDALLAKLDALDNKIDSLSGIDTSEIKVSLLNIRKELETNADNWEDISDKIEDVNVEVTRLERTYKSLDTPFKTQDIRLYNEEIKDISKAIKDVEKSADRIDGLGDLNTDLERASAGAKDLANSLNKVERAEDLLGTKLNVNIGGLSLQFDDVNLAIGVLEDKLYLLANSGLRNSQQFKDITAQIVNLRTAVKQVDNELDNAFSGGLNKAIQGVQGLTAIGSVSEGISGLFGVDGLDESIQKFASLSLILNGLKEVQELLRDSTGYLALAYNFLNETATSVTNGISNLFDKIGTGINILTGGIFNKLGKSLDNITTKWKALEKFATFKTLLESLDRIDKTNNVYKRLSKLIVDLNVAVDDLDFSELITPDMVTSIGRYGVGIDNVIAKLKKLKESGEVEISDKEYNDAVELLTEFDKSIDPTIRHLGNLKEELKALGVPFKLLNSIDFSGKLNIWQKGLILLVNGFKYAANGAKVLGAAIKGLLKSTIVFGLILAAIEAMSWAIDQVIKGFNWLTGQDLAKLVDPFEEVDHAIELTNLQLDKYKLNLQRLVDTKVISNQTRLNDTIAEYNRLLALAILNILSFKKEGANILNIDLLIEEFEILQKAVQGGTDKIKVISESSTKWYEVWKSQWWAEVWNTAGDAATEYAAVQKKVIDDVQYRLNNLSTDATLEEIKELIELLDTPIYAASIANIEKLFPEDEYAKVLAANIKLIREYYAEIQNLENEAAVEALNLNEQITDNNIAAIRNRFERERAELENNQKKELADAADNEELRSSIQRKYETLRALMAKSHANEVRNILNLISANEIAAMQDGLAKRLAELENGRQQEIDAARDSEIKVEELIAAINKKYDAQILEAKTEFYENRQKLLEDYSNLYTQMWREIADIEAEIATSRVNIKAQDLIESLGFTDESIDNIRQYYDKVRDIANEQAKKISEINKEHTQVTTDDSIKEEEKRNKERLEVIELNYKDGLLSKEDYDKAIQDENDLHYKRVEVITKQGEQRLIEILREYDETAKNNNITAINERIAAISEAYDNIEVEGKVSKLGIIDYKETKKELERAKNEITKILEEIAKERDKLQKAFDNKELSFNDFRQAKKELDNLEKDIQSSQREIGSQLENLILIVADSITQYVNQYISVLGDMWSTYNDIQMMRFEQEQARLEEEYDMLEDAYEKLEELTQKHTDKLNEIEDELKTSRGDRRAHLIELLNAEREAQLASLQEEQRIEKQKEINQKKQDALEKKRREQEKKNSIVQATINTFTAVTNALAVQPWFVGLALSAVALALGMAQVANIKKQKYASGGLLKGKSHSLGGIPVGNTGIEVEGDEYVINKRSTKNNLPLINYINNSNKRLTKEDLIDWYDNGKKNVITLTKNKFATGGVIPTLPNTSQEQTIVIQDDRPIVALIVDIVNSADNYRLIQVLSGLSGKTV